MRQLAYLWSLVVLLALVAGCNPPPRTRIALQASKTTVEAGGTVLLTATVTEDGEPLADAGVTFTASEGSFLDGTTVSTNEVGQATTRLEADPTGGIITEVTATVEDANKTASLTITVESGGGDGGTPQR